MKKLDPFGRIQLVPYIDTLKKEEEIWFYYQDTNQISWELSWLLWKYDYDLKLFQFQIIDYLYFTKFINFEITKN